LAAATASSTAATNRPAQHGPAPVGDGNNGQFSGYVVNNAVGLYDAPAVPVLRTQVAFREIPLPAQGHEVNEIIGLISASRPNFPSDTFQDSLYGYTSDLNIVCHHSARPDQNFLTMDSKSYNERWESYRMLANQQQNTPAGRELRATIVALTKAATALEHLRATWIFPATAMQHLRDAQDATYGRLRAIKLGVTAGPMASTIMNEFYSVGEEKEAAVIVAKARKREKDEGVNQSAGNGYAGNRAKRGRSNGNRGANNNNNNNNNSNNYGGGNSGTVNRFGPHVVSTGNGNSGCGGRGGGGGGGGTGPTCKRCGKYGHPTHRCYSHNKPQGV
jgi:hypothetical protein